MSEIVIRHAEPKDYDAIRQIHAQPEVYHNTLQVSSSFPRDVASEANRASRGQTTGCLY